VIFSTYGFWLPNDPRGSWSEFVGSWELFRFGPATKTAERRSLARVPHDRGRRLAAKFALKFPPVRFNDVQVAAVGRGFQRRVTNSGLTVWACAVMPDHVHMVVGRHTYDVERMAVLLKSEATDQLFAGGLHPFAAFRDQNGKYPTCWARGEWKVFSNSPDDIERSVQYAEANPEKEGKPRQKWEFVVPFVRDTGADF